MSDYGRDVCAETISKLLELSESLSALAAAASLAVTDSEGLTTYEVCALAQLIAKQAAAATKELARKLDEADVERLKNGGSEKDDQDGRAARARCPRA